MKIINLNTNITFNLPTDEAKYLLNSYPEDFAKITKNNKILKNKKPVLNDDSILKYILDES